MYSKWKIHGQKLTSDNQNDCYCCHGNCDYDCDSFLSFPTVETTSSSVCSGFFVLLKYPRINAAASKTNKITNPTQKKDETKNAKTKNMTSPVTERAVSSKNFMLVIFAGDVY